MEMFTSCKYNVFKLDLLIRSAEFRRQSYFQHTMEQNVYVVKWRILRCYFCDSVWFWPRTSQLELLIFAYIPSI